MTDLMPVDLQAQVKKAELMAASSLLPDAYRKQPANLLWAMEMAQALDVTLAQAVTGISVINGKPSMSAEMMRALVLRAGHRFTVTTLTDKAATVTVARREWPDDAQQFTFTWEDALHAGLAGSGTYKKHPKAMLLARATSLACRAVFPDVVSGMGYTPDELSPAAHTPSEARVVDTTRLHPQPAPDPKPEPEPVLVADDDGVIIDAELVEEPEPDGLDEFERTDTDAITPAQMKKLHALLRELGVGNRDDGLEMIGNIVGREVESTKTLTKDEASMVIDTLAQMEANQ